MVGQLNVGAPVVVESGPTQRPCDMGLHDWVILQAMTDRNEEGAESRTMRAIADQP